MFGLREAGVLGASVALAGGLAYLIWNYAASSWSSTGDTEPETRPGEDDNRFRQKGQGKEEKGDKREVIVKQTVEAVAAAPVVAVEAPKVSEPKSVESAGTKILVLGLDGAGKTSLLLRLATGTQEQDIEPTQGFNAVSINREDMNIEFLEIGGKEELRTYWQKYTSKALMLVFVVDSSNPQRFPLAKTHLHELLASDPRLPLMVLANKQDLPGACGITDLHEALSLSEIGGRKLFLIGTHVMKGEAQLSSGVQDARDMIIQMVSDGR